MAISGALAVAKRRGFSVARREAERSLGRFRAGVWPIVQTALAATLAWSAAALILGHEQPFVAAIAAVISIGSVAGQTLRRAVEWTLGVAVGLAVADFIMLALGSGPLQTGLMVGLAMSVALLIRGGVMFWTESGVSALLVAGLDPTTSGVSPDRFLEALIGGGMALAVSATFPSNPSVRAKQAARPRRPCHCPQGLGSRPHRLWREAGRRGALRSTAHRCSCGAAAGGTRRWIPHSALCSAAHATPRSPGLLRRCRRPARSRRAQHSRARPRRRHAGAR